MSNPTETTERLELAARFVNSTDSHIFLTGKAGTGKTTFLRDISAKTHKRHLIVAPTGIAALNAKGVTIHSQFLLPIGTFLPIDQLPEESGAQSHFVTQRSLAVKHPLNATRIKVLRSLELLIIDEVSMLRADVLDAIDYRLRQAKRNYRLRFGGVQLLLIGDLYQLPPIVRDTEKALMGRYYPSAHFFESLALKEAGFVFIELDKIFRQRNDDFIRLLNNLRNNTVTTADIDTLNAHYSPDRADDEKIITIATHNHQADSINRAALERLPGRRYTFEAEVGGDFPESMFPLPQELELKTGARVMFVKNDPSERKQFVNGNLATVEDIDLEDQEITVRLDGASDTLVLNREEWENKRYTLNEQTRDMDEEVLGTYSQFPIKLAWAVTVHKSQGLTFEKAIIDVGSAFAPGQVYVALSRLTSLDGLVLRTRIHPGAVSTDGEVIAFTKKTDMQGALDDILNAKESEYLHNLLVRAFSFEQVEKQMQTHLEKHTLIQEFEDTEMRSALDLILKSIRTEAENTRKFAGQLRNLLALNDRPGLIQRLEKGSDYYIGKIKAWIRDLLKHLEDVRLFSKTKTYQDALEELDVMLMGKWEEIEKISYLAQQVLDRKTPEKNIESAVQRGVQRIALAEEAGKLAKANPKNATGKTGRKRKPKAESASHGKAKPAKGDTYKTTFELLKSGLTIYQAALARGLAVSTIEGHAEIGIREGVLQLDGLMNQEDITTIHAALNGEKSISLSNFKERFGDKYSYNQIKMVLAHLDKSKK